MVSLPSRLQSPDLLNETEQKNLEDIYIINIQKALYDVKLTSLKQCIQNLDSVNGDLENDSKTLSDAISKTDENTKEQIKSCKDNLLSADVKVQNLKEQLKTKTRLREEEKEKHLEYVQRLAQKYLETFENLTSQLNSINKDIEMLETFQTNEQKLIEIFEEKEKLIEQNEKDFESTVQQIEEKYKLDKERITDNIFEMLFETAKQFHFETIKNLSMPFRRLVNESISIKSEMNDLNTFINLKENDIEHSKSDIVTNSGTIKKLQRCLEKFIKKIIYINQLARFIRENCIQPIDSDEITKAKFLIEMQSHKLENMKNQINKSIIEENDLKVVLFREKANLYTIQNFANRLICRCEILKDTYYDMKFVVLCAMEKSNSQDKELQKMDAFELVIHLLNIISRNKKINRCCEIMPY